MSIDKFGRHDRHEFKTHLESISSREAEQATTGDGADLINEYEEKINNLKQ